MRTRAPAVAAAALLAALLWAVAAPAPAAAQEAGRDGPGGAEATPAGGSVFLGGYAVLAYDPTARQLGLAAASGGFSVASGVPWLEQGAGATVVLGRRAPEAGRTALAALREGAAARVAAGRAAEAAGRSGGLQVAVLTPDCGTASVTADDAYPWTGTRSGRVGEICYLAAGSLLSDVAVLEEAVAAFRSAEGPLVDRFRAFLQGAERATGEVARSRSAVLWIDAPDAARGALGRAALRLQVDDVQRPADALRYLVRAGRADELAREASLAVDSGAFERAVELADSAVAREPASALAWLAKGRALLFRDEDAAAETAFQRMLEVNPYLLHVLGDPGRAARDTLSEAGGPLAPPEAGETPPSVRPGLIPYRPRLLLRLDVYRRSFFREVEFPEYEDGEAAGGDEGGDGTGDGPGGGR
mgnify:CR=1 FL=1